MAEPSFWDSLRSVGAGAASTAKNAFQNSLGSLSGTASQKINDTANQIQAKVESKIKNAGTKPAQPPPEKVAPKLPAAGFNLAGVAIALGAIYFLTRKHA